MHAGPGTERGHAASTLDLIVQPRVVGAVSLATDGYLVAQAARNGRGALRVFALEGEGVSLGRYHLAPPPVAGDAVLRWRRHSGGPVFPAGQGFLGVSLTLQHRSALVAPDPLALAPEQVMNRYVRGVLAGLQLLGVSAFYPGRDLVTVEGRPLGMVAFEVDAAGALLFEAIIANRQDASILPMLLERTDPGGVVRVAVRGPDAVTSVQRLRGEALDVEELAECLRRGYEERFAVRFERRALQGEEARRVEVAAQREFADSSWLAQRAPREDLDRHGSVTTQLGVLEAHFALDGDRIREIVFAGDFLANSPAIDALERTLRGRPAEASVVDALVHAIFGRAENYLLGLGPLRTVADAVARGLPA